MKLMFTKLGSDSLYSMKENYPTSFANNSVSCGPNDKFSIEAYYMILQAIPKFYGN